MILASNHNFYFLCKKIEIMLEIKEIKPSETLDLRHRILLPNKSIDSIILAEDDSGQHFGLFKDAQLIAVISLFIENDVAQFRKFATETAQQNKGYGSILLNRVVEEAIKNNVKNLWCNARMTALGFYNKFGFEIVSEKWITNDVEYAKMERTF
jgi:N-acetylglutamate synthase-like GNAT family acetyltransferase